MRIIAIKGEKSIPGVGTSFLIRPKTGSVILIRSWYKGLYGSVENHDMIALIIMRII